MFSLSQLGHIKPTRTTNWPSGKSQDVHLSLLTDFVVFSIKQVSQTEHSQFTQGYLIGLKLNPSWNCDWHYWTLFLCKAQTYHCTALYMDQTHSENGQFHAASPHHASSADRSRYKSVYERLPIFHYFGIIENMLKHLVPWAMKIPLLQLLQFHLLDRQVLSIPVRVIKIWRNYIYICTDTEHSYSSC